MGLAPDISGISMVWPSQSFPLASDISAVNLSLSGFAPPPGNSSLDNASAQDPSGISLGKVFEEVS